MCRLLPQTHNAHSCRSRLFRKICILKPEVGSVCCLSAAFDKHCENYLSNYHVLMDKVSHTKILGIYLSKKQLKSGSVKAEVVRSTVYGGWGKTVLEKRPKEILDCSLKPLSLAVCDWLSLSSLL